MLHSNLLGFGWETRHPPVLTISARSDSEAERGSVEQIDKGGGGGPYLRPACGHGRVRRTESVNM